MVHIHKWEYFERTDTENDLFTVWRECDCGTKSRERSTNLYTKLYIKYTSDLWDKFRRREIEFKEFLKGFLESVKAVKEHRDKLKAHV